MKTATAYRRWIGISRMSCTVGVDAVHGAGSAPTRAAFRSLFEDVDTDGYQRHYDCDEGQEFGRPNRCHDRLGCAVTGKSGGTHRSRAGRSQRWTKGRLGPCLSLSAPISSYLRARKSRCYSRLSLWTMPCRSILDFRRRRHRWSLADCRLIMASHARFGGWDDGVPSGYRR